MQPFSPLHSATDVWEALQVNVSAERLALFFAAGLAANLVAVWIASLPVAGEKATLGRAAKTWAAVVGIFCVLVLAAGVGMGFASREPGGAARVLVPLVFCCLAAVALLGVPMAVYGIGLLRSAGFNVIQLVAAGAMTAGLKVALLGAGPVIDPASLRQVLAPTPPDPAQVEAAWAQVRERQALLARRHEALEIRRRHLPPGDSVARGDYEREREAYERDLASLRAEVEALPQR